jgi:hypothetical protein
MDYPKTGKEARETKSPKYFTGLECKYGHISPRYAHNGQCVKCGKIAGRAARETPAGKIYEKEYYKRIRVERFEQIMWASAKGRAKDRGVPFNISKQDILDVWPDDNKCPVLGIELKHNYDNNGSNSSNSPSLDSVDPLKGYVKGNIAIISQKANKIKNNETDPETFRKIANWIELNLNVT